MGAGVAKPNRTLMYASLFPLATFAELDKTYFLWSNLCGRFNLASLD